MSVPNFHFTTHICKIYKGGKIYIKEYSKSRLDYWLVPESFIYRTVNTEIDPGVYSDHSIISIKIRNSNNSKETRDRGSIHCYAYN